MGSRLNCVVAAVLSAATAACADAAQPRPGNQAQQELERIRVLLPAATKLQQDVLADGVVTEAERDQIDGAVVSCAAKAGVVVEVQRDEQGTRQYQVAGTKDAAESDRRQAEFEECYALEAALADSAYAVHHALSDTQQATLRDAVIQCLADRGITTREWPSAEIIDRAAEADCYALAMAEL